MIHLRSLGITTVLALVCGCSSSEREGSVSERSETGEFLKEFQQRAQVSDEELVSVVQRWVKFDQAFKEMVREGLLTEEDVGEMFVSLPQKMSELDGLEEKMLQQDAMAAAIALSVLKSHHEGDIERTLPGLRYTVAQYCKRLPDPPSEEEAGFREKTERFAESDSELKALLESE